MNSTTDGKIYKMVVCSCGKQTTLGVCQHINNPMIIEYVPGFELDCRPNFWKIK